MDPTTDIAGLTSLTPSPAERADGAPTEETVARGAAMFARDGCLVMHDVFDPAFLQGLAKLQIDQVAAMGTDGMRRTHDSVGNLRYQVLLEMEGAYADPRLWANPFVMAILRRLFDHDCMIGAFGSVVALPGAGMQHPHRDITPIFGLNAISASLPPYCVNLFVPLVDLDREIGTTAVNLGSHANPEIRAANMMEHPMAFPMVKVGGCYLIDYRTFHVGLSNDTDRVRPIIFTVYHRPWFRDYQNFTGHEPVRLSDDTYAGLSEEHRGLLALSDAAARAHAIARVPGAAPGR